jgi:hypothetical protein
MFASREVRIADSLWVPMVPQKKLLFRLAIE